MNAFLTRLCLSDLDLHSLFLLFGVAVLMLLKDFLCPVSLPIFQK